MRPASIFVTFDWDEQRKEAESHVRQQVQPIALGSERSLAEDERPIMTDQRSSAVHSGSSFLMTHDKWLLFRDIPAMRDLYGYRIEQHKKGGKTQQNPAEPRIMACCRPDQFGAAASAVLSCGFGLGC